MKSLIGDLTVNGYAWLAAIASWQVDLENWIRIFAGLSAIAVSIVTIYFKFKKNGQDK